MDRCLAFVLLFVVLFWLPESAQAARITPELQAAMQGAAGQQDIAVMVVLESQADLRVLPSSRKAARRAMVQSLRQVAAASQEGPRAAMQARKARDLRSLWIVNALAARVPAAEIAGLATLPGVKEVRLDRALPLPVRPAAEPPSGVSTSAIAWNVEAVGAPALWARGLTGAGVVVASMDSGVDLAHPDLAPGWRGGSNSWFDPNNEHSTPFDSDGHGTGTLGVIVARNSELGVAPGATWIAVKIFDDAGLAFNSRIHEGFQWLLDPDGNPATDDAPDIVNNSWGFEQDPGVCDALAREFQPDVQALKAAGIAVVFAAGNTGPNSGTSVSPANYPESVAVGAVNATLQAPLFSARGPSSCDGRIYPDLVAPGVGILVPDLTAGGIIPNSYQTVSGTSYSTPHVAGVMALLLSDPVRPAPAPAALEEALQRSATDLGSSGPDNAYGAGLVNALAANNALNNVPQLAVFDSTPPASDRRIAFGHLPPGASVERTVELVNAGGGQLDILGVDTALLPPSLSLVSNGCVSLLAGERCALVFRFAPLALGSVTATVTVNSSDPEQGIQTLQLEGVGNTLPTPAALVSPGDGATELATTVEFTWNPGTDADGGLIAETLVIASNPGFLGSARFPATAAAGTATTALLGGAFGLIGFGLLRRRPLLAAVVAAALLLTLAACGGGGGGGGIGSPAASTDLASLRLTGLQPGTTYYWKVETSDSLGGLTESATSRFLTRP